MIAQAQRYKKLPSEIIKIDDEYTAFCFDEACAYIMGKIDAGENPVFFDDDSSKNKDKITINHTNKKEYKTPSEYYKEIEKLYNIKK